MTEGLGSTSVAIEIGGTFTDLVVSRNGRIDLSIKVPSTPKAPADGALAALDALGMDLGAIEILLHGSTVATNAVLERKGSPTALVVTEGFRDLLEIQREERSNLYDLQYRKPVPLVPRDRVVPAPERLDVDGVVVRALDEAELMRRIEPIVAGGITSLAVCLLHAYRYNVHEERILELLRERFPDVHISLSSRIIPEFREYERASTTVINAFVAPIMDRYVGLMQGGLAARSFEGSFRIVQSNGGVLPASQIAEQAARVILSGPAAGVMGAIHVAGASGKRNLITFDMGGTSSDVCLVENGTPMITADSKIDGLPVRIPMIDITTVGAGGGSIASVNGLFLQVGPESAGADPGPACYGRGGTRATVTDANLLLGRIRPRSFFGGRMVLDREKAAEVVRPIADRLGLSLLDAAESIVRVANAAMAHAVRLVSVERGHDPREQTLVAFGGGGGLHAVALAEDLEARDVLVPVKPGVLSALGLLVAEFKRDYVQTDIRRLNDVDVALLRQRFSELEERALEEVAGYGIAVESLKYAWQIDMRYQGQAYELGIPIDLAAAGDETGGLLAAAYHRAHTQRYGHASDDPLEIVNYRLTVTSPQPPVALPPPPQRTAPKVEEGEIYLNGATRACRFCSRSDLPVAHRLEGPVVIEEETATTFVLPGWVAFVDEIGNLQVERAG